MLLGVWLGVWLLRAGIGVAAGQAASADPASAPDPAAARKAWMVGIARIEGASADVEAAGVRLAQALRAAGEGGRVQQLPAVRTEADALNRLVLSADLAARNLKP